MDILIIIGFVLSIWNTILLITVAASMVKLVKHIGARVNSPRISRQRRYLNVDGRTPTYADVGVMAPTSENIIDRPANWDGVSPRPSNWDGIPQAKE